MKKTEDLNIKYYIYRRFFIKCLILVKRIDTSIIKKNIGLLILYKNAKFLSFLYLYNFIKWLYE